MPKAGTGLAGELGFKRRDDPAAYTRAWRAKNREKSRAYANDYHAKRMKTDPEYREMKRLAAIDTRRKVKYGLSREDYAAMVEVQDGRCAVCGEVPNKSLRVDHDHATGKVRALLCDTCNAGLGQFHEDIGKLENAIVYLLRHMQCEGGTQ